MKLLITILLDRQESESSKCTSYESALTGMLGGPDKEKYKFSQTILSPVLNKEKASILATFLNPLIWQWHFGHLSLIGQDLHHNNQTKMLRKTSLHKITIEDAHTLRPKEEETIVVYMWIILYLQINTIGNRHNNNNEEEDIMLPHFVSETVINLSLQKLTDPQVSLLSKGLKLSIL